MLLEAARSLNQVYVPAHGYLSLYQHSVCAF